MTTKSANEQACSLTEALSVNAIPLSAVAAGKVLLVAGVTGVAWRESSKPGRPPKSYKVATALGESLGIVNEASTLPTGDPVLVKYVPSMFASLWASDEVQEALADLLKAGDVKYRDGAAQDAGEVF
ncbi:hypothetical protein PQR46_18770 [Paraburkholderia sediminicola]|uniref:hypothetical protein n=1 Tax=Paraburkholderia sediminicola TaxID=458836 RepID=UPI0038B9C426